MAHHCDEKYKYRDCCFSNIAFASEIVVMQWFPNHTTTGRRAGSIIFIQAWKRLRRIHHQCSTRGYFYRVWHNFRQNACSIRSEQPRSSHFSELIWLAMFWHDCDIFSDLTYAPTKLVPWLLIHCLSSIILVSIPNSLCYLSIIISVFSRKGEALEHTPSDFMIFIHRFPPVWPSWWSRAWGEPRKR